MSYKDFQAFTTENCREYKKIFEIGIGGFLYLAFLPDAYHKILCISSDYISIIDSENGQVTPIDGDYDEIELVAMCEGYDSPIPIAGQYGGSLPLDNGKDIRVTMDKDQSEEYPILTIYWGKDEEAKSQIYKGYLPYIFGFSPDGRYYVHADDGGLTVLKQDSCWREKNKRFYNERIRIIAKKKATFVCQNCEYNSPKYLGRCPNCGAWSSFVEEVEVAEVKNARVSLTGEKTKPMKLAEVTSINVNRTKTEMEEFNRVLGGGVVPGSLVLIGGDPGIGKSTLLLQVSTQLSQVGTVLYVSGEESAQQIKLRAERLGDIDSEFYLYAETNMQSVRAEVERIQPDFLIIDSIQTIMSPEISGVQGSVSQVREVTAELMQLAKTNNIAIFIVGHVTKEGTLAGPRMLEHMVDTVLYFEGERHHTFRILRAVKNRFGSTNEIGIFEMQSGGLVEVLNPSQVFLEERLDGATGSSIVVTMEGTRPILAEVQALVTPTMFGNAKRTTTGLDFNRASLIMAVLEKRAGLLLQNQDAYLKSAGGVKLDEPAIDLAVAVAIASSYKDKPTNPQECFVGELGLTGEVRRVNRIEQRINEAAKLGFTKIYVPKNSLTGISTPSGIQVVGVSTLAEVLKKVF